MNILFVRAGRLARAWAEIPGAARRVFPAACLFLAGCAAPEVFSGGREFVVRRETNFFLYGPAQPGRPEKLPDGTFLDVLKKDPAYSYVKLSDGRTGYVGSADLSTAPPRAPAVPFDPPEPAQVTEPPPPNFQEVPEEISIPAP
ncbi:MAG: hypothetical protein WCS31_13785 [Verrucomicrobiae bacterium]